MLLMLAGTPAHADLNQDEALVQAARKGELQSVNALLQSGANPNLRNADGISALGVAAGQGHVAVVQALLAAKADPNFKDVNGDTALLLAAQQGRLGTVELLLAAGADPNPKSRMEGRSAVLLATMNRSFDVALRLLQAGADGNATTSEGDAPLRWVVGGSTAQHLGLVRALLAAHVNVEAGQFPAYSQPKESRCELPTQAQEMVVTVACLRGLRNAEGTPLGIAAASGSPEIVQALLAARANVNARQPGWRTPLMIAAMKGRTDVVRLLLAAGADVAARDSADQTAQLLAAAHPQVVELLQAAATPATAIRGAEPEPESGPRPSPTVRVQSIMPAAVLDDPIRMEKNGQLKDGVLELRGPIDAVMRQRFEEAVAAGGLTTVRITSPGGEIVHALRIGAIMQARDIDVIVHDLCAGACAQYIFIAGRKRRLERESLVGFMNTIKSSSIVLAMATEALQVRNTVSATAERLVALEEELYRKRGVSAALLVDPMVALQPRCVLLKREGTAMGWNTTSNYMMWVPSRDYLTAAGVEFEGDWPKSDFQLGGLKFTYMKLRYSRSVRFADDDPLRSKKQQPYTLDQLSKCVLDEDPAAAPAPG
jgi:ankyrin repeat protein